VVETRQWGDNLLFWVGDKAIGGKMCALIHLGRNGGPQGFGPALITYPAHPERFAELVELEGVLPAKYLARASWLSVLRWDVFRVAEWHRELSAAHALKLAKLPPKVRAILALPKAEQRRIVMERRKLLAAKEAAKELEKSAGNPRKSLRRFLAQGRAADGSRAGRQRAGTPPAG
jgi:predicted DNA-binding protein (MmcQ/YjbR family)